MSQSQSSEKKEIPAVDGSSWVPKLRAVQSHLAGSENDEPVSRIEQLTDVLERVRVSTLPVQSRFKSIEYCGQEIAKLSRDLDRSLAGLSLPLPREKDRLSRKFADTHRLAAECYKGVALEIAGDGGHGASDAECLKRSCYAGIDALGQYLLVSYQRYLKARPGVWLDTHRLYNTAVSEGVQDTPLDARAPSQTVKHMYKRVLLLGLSDPFHHPFRALAQVYIKLDHWASMASLTTTSVNSSRCLFTVDPALDRPAMPALSASRIRPQFNEKWLNTRQLVDYLKQQHHNAAKSATNRMDQPKGIAEELDSLERLRRMIVHWGIHPIRNTIRTRTYKCCDVVVGLRSVCVALNEFQPFVVDNVGSHTAVVRMMKGTFEDANRQAVNSTQISTQWEIADESERGFKLVSDTIESGPSVSIGEMVAVRTESSEGWTLGSVHWAQTDEKDRLSLGIKRIKNATCEPVTVFRLRTDQALDHTRCSGLLLHHQAQPGTGGTISVLCDKSLYFPTAVYLVRQAEGGHERVVEASNVLLTTRSFVWFEAHKPRADTKQKTLDLIYPK